MSDNADGVVSEDLIATLLAFADDEHLMGQQHTEWIGVAPFLEEDLAFSSIAQDELGHAALLYERVLTLRGVEATEAAIDELAYRTAEQYCSCALAEYSTDDWAEALVRHWIYDAAEALRWQALASGDDDALRELAVVAERDEVFHRRHADALLDRLLNASVARDRVLAALDRLLPLVAGLFAPASPGGSDKRAADTSSATLALDQLSAGIAERFGVEPPVLVLDVEARSSRSAHFAPLMARMREVIDLDAQAVW